MSNRFIRAGARHPRRSALAALAAIAGAAVLAMAGMAVAKSFTLEVAKNATVTDMTTHVTGHEAIATNSKGFAVYSLSGDSKSHPQCTKANGCFTFWPPVTAASAKSLTKAAGIKGKLTSWSRDGFVQAVLGGHPLYTFAPDTKKDDATGQGVVGFGGTWHVVTASSGTHGSNSQPSGMQAPTPTPTPSPYQSSY
jgi:predicted lipoprotein with Yx(FWY)xxD motif